MNTQAMSQTHQNNAPWVWPLDAHQATTLAAAPVARWLRVEAGKVWITAAASNEQPEDIWLEPGQSLALPAGSAWVVDA